MTGQRTWVCTLDGDAVAVDQIVRYGVAGLGDTGRAVLTVHTISDVAHHLGLFGSASQALDFARRHFGPVVDPADLILAADGPIPPTADVAKHDPAGAADMLAHLDAAIALGREAQREAVLYLDGPEVA